MNIFWPDKNLFSKFINLMSKEKVYIKNKPKNVI